MNELLSLSEKVIKALRKFGCYIFESRELEKVRDLAIKAEINKFVEIKPVDERYPHIFAMIVARRGIERECIARVESMLSRGELSQSEYKRYKRELLEQCIVSLEKERVKEVIAALEKHSSMISRAV
ncbi:MAG: hypothetical protein QXK88_00995 [Desulfurococcaceae archaeon]